MNLGHRSQMAQVASQPNIREDQESREIEESSQPICTTLGKDTSTFSSAMEANMTEEFLLRAKGIQLLGSSRERGSEARVLVACIEINSPCSTTGF